MGAIEKGFAFVMFPLGFLIMIEEMGLFSLSFFLDKTMIGAILMIVLQTITLMTLNMHHEYIRGVNYMTFFCLILPSALYLGSMMISISFKESLPLIIGVMMFVESLYAFH